MGKSIIASVIALEVSRRCCCLGRALLLAISVAGLAAPALAVEQLEVLALTGGRAILRIDGARRVLSDGEVSPEGVRLLKATSEQAVVEVDGRQETLHVSMVSAPLTYHSPPPTAATATLWVGSDGFFHAEGTIGNRAVKFLVDTGANAVALSSVLADRLQIDYRHGKPGIARTASGNAPMYAVKLARVSVQGITLYDVDASVLVGAYPDQPLLGASFLNRLEMVRQGDRLELRARH